MATATVTKKLREETTCPICLELMTEPVSIDCGHIYCRLCIVGLTENRSSETSSPGTFSCPQCRKPFKIDSLRPNKHLQNIIETIQETERERFCEKHGEQIHLFCEEDGKLICWRCERSPEHKGHVTAIIEDVCQGYREQLQKTVTKLKDTEVKYMQLKQDTTQNIRGWEEKIRLEKERIHSEFMNLHTFLDQEEEFYMCRLDKEKEEQLSKMQDNAALLENKLQELKNCILELDKKCQGSAQNLLQGIKDTLSRVSAIYLEAPEDVSLEMRTVCNVSELHLSVRKILKRHQVNVTLDPETAHSVLHLSDDRKRVSAREFSQNSQSSGTYNVAPFVLGCEHFTSGRHYFEVAVKNAKKWSVGVCLENVARAIESGFWAIRRCTDETYLALTSPPTPLHLRNKPEVVGIMVDCDTGLVSFYNATTGSHIYTFPRASFSCALRPYFQVRRFSSLSLDE